MTSLAFDRLKSLLEDAGMETTRYSGRGMYGAHCLGACFEGSSEAMFVAEMAAEIILNADDLEAAAEEIQALRNTMRDTHVDSMGRGTVIYWPSIKWEGPDPDEEEGE